MINMGGAQPGKSWMIRSEPAFRNPWRQSGLQVKSGYLLRYLESNRGWQVKKRPAGTKSLSCEVAKSRPVRGLWLRHKEKPKTFIKK
jgi:hypothetical protein